MIKGGCDLFTTKPIGSDRKLFKTIHKHLDQIIEDNQYLRSMERERQNSVHSMFGSSLSPPKESGFTQRGSYTTERERRMSAHLPHFNKEYQQPADESDVDESPFGPLKNTTTRKTFAYLIAILNSTYPDHDFLNLQPTTENFHRIHSPEDLMNKFNNLMISLGKKESTLNWIWDTVNVYMDILPSKTSSPHLGAQIGGLRKNSLSTSSSLPKHSSNGHSHSNNDEASNHHNQTDNCQIYLFEPSDESILDDLSYPYQTMWLYYWFIYNKKRKRVSFIYLTALNKVHYSQINSNRNINTETQINGGSKDDDDEVYLTEYDEFAVVEDNDDTNNDVVGDLEI